MHVDVPPPEDPPPVQCDLSDNRAPKAPTILTPRSGSIGLVPEELVISSSAFVDPDGDAHAATTVEIWRIRDGVVDSLVWRAQLAGAVTSARLRDGMLLGDGLRPWKSYVILVSYRDDAPCPKWSGWSPPVTFRSDDGSAYLFDEEQIRRVDVTLPPDSWAAIDAEAYPPGEPPYFRTYYPGQMSLEGRTFDAGVRIKGSQSSRDLEHKAALKVNLDWDDPNVFGCPLEVRLYGEKHFTFNNMVQDPTMAHEMLGYAFLRQLGVPSPRVSHVRLYLNGELSGLYLHIETLDRRYLERRFASSRGMMYEGTLACDFIAANIPPADDATTCFDAEFKAGPCEQTRLGDDPLGYSMLTELIARIDALPAGGLYPAIEEFFDFDNFLIQWAADSIIGHWCGYEGTHVTNYRIYHDPSTDRWTLINIGLDLTFEASIDPWVVGAILSTRCVQEPQCEAAMVAHVEEALRVFEAMDLAGMDERIEARIRADVEADPHKTIDMATFAVKHQELRQWIRDRPASVRQHLQWHGY